MATTTPNLQSLSSSLSLTNLSSHFSATCITFQFPKKPIQISCFSSKKPAFLNSTQLHGFTDVGITASVCNQQCFNFHVSPLQKLALGRESFVAKATETVATSTEEAVATQSKSSKKAKKTKYPRRILDVYQILQVPIITEAAIKNIADENSLLFTVDVRADKKMIREAISNFFGVKVRKVNTLIRPDGTKKAYVMLSREYNASDLAKKIGIFPGSG